MERKDAVLPFVMGSLAFVCFLLAAVFLSAAVQPPWSRIPVLLLPALVLWGIGVLARKGMLSSRMTEALTVGLTILFLLLSLVYVFFLSLRIATTTITDTKYYERAYGKIGGNEAVRACFPARIPEDAQDAAFSYTPQFLQGGEVFELSYRTMEDRLMERIGQLQAAAEWSGSNEEWFRMHNQGAGDSELLRFQLFGEGFSNHGEEGYCLVDRSACRITFCYSRW